MRICSCCQSARQIQPCQKLNDSNISIGLCFRCRQLFKQCHLCIVRDRNYTYTCIYLLCAGVSLRLVFYFPGGERNGRGGVIIHQKRVCKFGKVSVMCSWLVTCYITNHVAQFVLTLEHPSTKFKTNTITSNII